MANSLSESDRNFLKNLAHESIRMKLEKNLEPTIDAKNLSPGLNENRATFVTLNMFEELRGCIGSLIAHRALYLDIMSNAKSAAFEDPRFPPLELRELEKLDIHISVLTVPEQISVSSEDDLLSRLRVGVDGLLLKDGNHQSTFLPSVWEMVGSKKEFLMHLKRKAGLDVNHWSKTIELYTYQCEEF